MKLVLKLKLITDNNSNDLLITTTQIYWRACNILSKIAFEHRIFTKYDLQRLAYHEIKTKLQIPSQLLVRAIAEVCYSYKTQRTQIINHNKTCKPEDRRELVQAEFKPNIAVPYDERVLRVDTEKQQIYIRTLHKRIRLGFQAGEERKHLLQYICGQADLKHIGKTWYLFQTLEVPEGDPVVTTNHLGVDSGICNVATMNDGRQTVKFPGNNIRKVRTHYYETRKSLQHRNTKSSRRRIQIIRNKESRIVRNYNHLVSCRIVEHAKRTNSTIVLEILDGIREGVKVGKEQRRERFSWSYAQLIGFITYKAQLAGIPVIFVPAYYTSKTCSRCNYMSDSNRRTQAWFKCKMCGFCWNADDNAAINIRFLGAESTRHKRRVCMREYLWTDRRKPTALAVGS